MDADILHLAPIASLLFRLPVQPTLLGLAM